jgi:hypothetical protein
MATIDRSRTEMLSINIDYGVLVLIKGDNPALDSMEPISNEVAIRLLKVFGKDTGKVDVTFVIDEEGRTLKDITVRRKGGIDGPRAPTVMESEEIAELMEEYRGARLMDAYKGEKAAFRASISKEDIKVYLERILRNGVVTTRGSITSVSTGRTKEMSADDSTALADALGQLNSKGVLKRILDLDNMIRNDEDDEDAAYRSKKVEELIDRLQLKYFGMGEDR